MFTSIKRIIFWGRQSFVRNSGASFATTIVMMVVISLITSLFLLERVTNFTIETLQEKIALTVYFRDEAPEDEILRVKRELTQMPAVERVDYISQEEALEDFKEQHRENPIIMESLAMVGENPLLSHLNIRAKLPTHYEKISQFLGEASFGSLIDHLNYPQVRPVISKIEQITGGLTNMGIVLSIIFGLVAVLVVFNTVKLAIYNFGEEIKIMRLVGASNWSIRGPLLVQGVIAGVLATAASLAVFTFLIFLFSPKLDVLLPGLDLFGYFIANLFEIILLQLAVGVGLGVLATTLAIRRYLAV